MALAAAVVVAALAGIHIATWGMYKDAPHEGYTPWKFARAILLASLIGFLLVVDGSALPTSGAVNPSLTIAANALRAADSLVRRESG